jgi:CBS domain containing-hemolysin-like protein
MTSDNADPGSLRGLFRKAVSAAIRLFKKDSKELFDRDAFNNLDTPRKDMIRGVLGLSSDIARDIMIPRVDVVAVEAGTDLKRLVKTVYEAGHSRVPVYDETIDNLIGVLYVKDLLKLLIEPSRKKFQLKKILHEPFFVPETMPLDELLLEFKLRKLHIAIVVDEYGGMGGIVTLEDILVDFLGEIRDEYDPDELPEIEKINKNTWELDSRLTISDFNEIFGLKLSTENFDTVGGYVFDLFGKIPEQGATVTDGDLTFKIKDINGTVINRIIVTMTQSK